MKYYTIAFYKAWAELKTEASRGYVGFVWWFIEPLLYLGAFYLIFEVGLRIGGEGYLFFLLCGLVPWKWISSTVSSGSRAIEANRGLIVQVYLPKHILPAITVLTNSVKFLVIFLLLLVVLSFNGMLPSAEWLALLYVVPLSLWLIFAATFLAASLVPLVPDLKLLIDNGLLMFLFMSGIFVDIDNLSEPIREVLYMNPIAVLIKSYRMVLLEHEWPMIDDMLYVGAFGLVTVLLAYLILTKLDRQYPKVV